MAGYVVQLSLQVFFPMEGLFGFLVHFGTYVGIQTIVVQSSVSLLSLFII